LKARHGTTEVEGGGNCFTAAMPARCQNGHWEVWFRQVKCWNYWDAGLPVTALLVAGEFTKNKP